jgi:endonuclease YncB( thermonuclease family)
MKGIVCGILSGDSLIVRFVDNPQAPIQIVCLEYLIAPKFGRSDGAVKDEPFGFDAWTFLRDNCIGKRVLVQSCRPTQQERIHPAFGHLSVIYTKVTLAETNQDVGLMVCREGWVKLREMKNFKSSTSQYMAELTKAQEEAKEQKKGIWCGKEGFVRKLPVKVNIENILNQKEFECNVEGIKNSTTLSLFVLPTHENIILSLAGVKPVTFDNEKMRELARVDARNKFLNKKVHIRITQFNEQFKNFNDVPSFIGSILDKPLQAAVADTVGKGYAFFNKKNQDYCPNTDDILMKQYFAQQKKNGFWETHDATAPEIAPSIAGIITSIKGSNGLNIIVEGQNKTIYLNNIKVPRYSTIIGSEAGGFEAREFLRKRYIKKFVSIDIEGQTEDRIYGTVSMKGVSINEELVENGLAEYSEPVFGIKSSRQQKIIEAERKAKAAKIGIWSEKFQPFLVTDYTSSKNLQEQLAQIQGKSVKCIIEYILSSTRYTVLIPELHWLIRVSLDGLIPLASNDKFGKIAKNFCQENILQSEVEIVAKSIDDKLCLFWVDMKQLDGQNIAIKILELGYSEIHPKFLATQETDIQYLKDAQDSAKARSQGIWCDHTRHLQELGRGTSYPVTVTAVWNPTTLVVQHNGDAFKTVTQILNTVETERIKEIPLKNDCLVYHVKGRFFRVRVENVDANKQVANVRLIDYHQPTEAKFEDLHVLPEALRSIPPQGRPITLAGLKAIEKTREEIKADCDYIWEIVKDAVLYLQVVKNDDAEPSVVLLDRETIDGAGCLGSVLVQKKIASYVEGEYPAEFSQIFAQLKAISVA